MVPDFEFCAMKISARMPMTAPMIWRLLGRQPADVFVARLDPSLTNDTAASCSA